MLNSSASRPSPADLYGALFTRVQERAVFRDGKTFVDAVPTRPIVDIMTDFADVPDDDAALLEFVVDNFELPPSVEPPRCETPRLPLRGYIRSTWRELARAPECGAANSSALPVNHRHVVPGGRFREIYYWDSFFTMLGLIRDGESALANGIVEAMTDLIEEHGHVPNGSRTYYLGRSQPPLFHMMVALLDDRRPAVARRRLAAMKREHAWWMEGEAGLSPGTQARHVARLADGSLLNRYWDPRALPRDESWREDIETAQASARPAAELYRELRAGAESGWDFSSRWQDGGSLQSIRVTAIAPVDLNAFLYGLEMEIAGSDDPEASQFADRASRRRSAMHLHMWDRHANHFADLDLNTERPRPVVTAAAFAPLLVGLANDHQADLIVASVARDLLAPGGLRTTLTDTGQQWDMPNGWAPLQWIAVAGLRRYGHETFATEIAERWIATVETTYARTGLLFEKYNVEAPAVGGGGEYAPQVGFGWTNGVTAEFVDWLERADGDQSAYGYTG